MKFLSPLQNGAISSDKYDKKGTLIGKHWKQKRPVITQSYGNDLIIDEKHFYAQWGMKGHNGTDYRAATGTKLFSPCDGFAMAKRSKDGYGWHIRIRNDYHAVEFHLAHLSKFAPIFEDLSDGQEVPIAMGDLVGFTGNSGASLAQHLHLGFRRLEVDRRKPIFLWRVKDYENGFFGHIDSSKYLLNFKGTAKINTIS